MDETYLYRIMEGLALMANAGMVVEHKLNSSEDKLRFRVIVRKPDESVEVFDAPRLPYAFEKACRKLTTAFDN